jgi:predicted HTH transcriptional regulator
VKKQAQYIEELIMQGENLHQDFKFAINDSKKIARSLVAFSNTSGGRLLIGVKDNGAIVGISTDEEYHMIEAAADMYCKPKVIFETKDWNINGKKVLEIIIPESKIKPHMALTEDKKWMAYIRVADENITANAVLLKVWQKQKSLKGVKIKDTETGKKLLMYLNDNENITLSHFLKLAHISYYKAVNILSDYISLGLIEPNYSDKKFVYRVVK